MNVKRTSTLQTSDRIGTGPADQSLAGDPLATRKWTWRFGPGAVLGVAFLAYLALSVALWWGVWSSHPTTVTTCGCDDRAYMLWFLEWPAYALAHGHNPLYSTAMSHASGINLPSNTSILGIGIPLAPVTWLFGPLATMNVASTLGPALSAISMFWLVRRWVTWTPSAFVAGLVFGFSPFMLDLQAVGQLNLSTLFLLPLMVGCLDELLIRQRRPPLVVGSTLGLFLVAQFFISTEIFVVSCISACVGLVLLVGYAGVGHRAELARRFPDALRGLLVAAGLAVVLLAYPVWFALRGPAHLAGLVWPNLRPGAGGISLSNIWHLGYVSQSGTKVFAGYQGPALPQLEYLGLGLVAVLVAGVVIWNRDRRLWFFAAMTVSSITLSLGDQTYWTPWRLLTYLPVVDNVIPARVVGVTSLCTAVMLAVVVDNTRRAVRSRGDRAGRWRSRVAASTCALIVAVVAIVPMAAGMTSNFPLTTRAVSLDGWFSHVAPHLPSNQVVLTFPPPGVGGSTLAWQAVDRLHFAMATGAGPGDILARDGTEAPAEAILDAAATPLGRVLAPTTAHNIDAMRSALGAWGVTVVVVPRPGSLVAPYGQPTATAWAVRFFTRAIGRAPEYRGGAWVWTGVDRAMQSRPVVPDASSEVPRRTDRPLEPDAVTESEPAPSSST